MANLLLYIKSHVFKSSTAALKIAYAERNNKEIKYAEKLLRVKMSSVNKLHQPSRQDLANNKLYMDKLQKLKELSRKDEKPCTEENYQRGVVTIDEFKGILTRSEGILDKLGGMFSQIESEINTRSGRLHNTQNEMHLNKLKDIIIQTENIIMLAKEVDITPNENSAELKKTLSSYAENIACLKKWVDLLSDSMNQEEAMTISCGDDLSQVWLNNKKVKIDFPQEYCACSLDKLFNDFNTLKCGGTLFDTIKSIEDFPDARNDLTLAIVDYLEKSSIDITSPCFPVESILNNLLLKYGRHNNDKTQKYIEKLLNALIGKVNDPLVFYRLSDGSLRALINWLIHIQASEDFNHAVLSNNFCADARIFPIS